MQTKQTHLMLCCIEYPLIIIICLTCLSGYRGANDIFKTALRLLLCAMAGKDTPSPIAILECCFGGLRHGSIMKHQGCHIYS